VHCFGGPREGRPGTVGHRPPDALEGANPACRPSGWTCRWWPRSAAWTGGSTSRTPTPGTPTWPGTWRRCCTTCRTSSPRTRSSRAARGRPSSSAGLPLSSWVERTAYEYADAVVAVSAGMRTDVLDCYPALDPARVHVVHNGIDTGFYAPDPPGTPCATPGSTPTAPASCSWADHPAEGTGPPGGRRAPHRPGRPAGALRGRAGHPGARRGDRAGRGRARAGPRERRLGAPDAAHRGVRQLLSAATVFVCPSVYEPLGIVNLEAMACGTAVVASDVGGIPEVVDDGATGCSCTSTSTPSSGSAPTWPTPSTRCWPTPAGPPRWGGGAGAGRARLLLGAGRGPHRGDLRVAAVAPRTRRTAPRPGPGRRCRSAERVSPRRP
jgi:starch synthase